MAPNATIVIQARMGSTRLPGKVIKNIDNDYLLLDLMLDRLSVCPFPIILATSVLASDDILEAYGQGKGICVIRGDERDVMSRYYSCLEYSDTSNIVRLTADCPLVDGQLLNQMVGEFEAKNIDYLGNTTPPETSKYPDGSDIEIFTRDALIRATNEETCATRREHVTFQFWQDEKYKSETFESNKDLSKFRYTVDHPEDLEVVRLLWKNFIAKNLFANTQEITDFIANNDLLHINSQFNPGDNW